MAMHSPVSRRLTLIDAMVLIASIALALVPIRPLFGEVYQLPEWRSPGDALRLGACMSLLAEPMALTLSLALWLLRLRKPRPRLRRVFRQPGMAACTATVVGITSFIIFTIMILSINFLLPSPYDYGFGFSITEPESWLLAGSVMGFAVLPVWTVLWLAGAWRAEPSWIDRTGRVLGVYWVLNSFVGLPWLI